LTIWQPRNNIKKKLVKSQNQRKFDYLFEGGSAGCTYVLTNTFSLFVNDVFEKHSIFSSWKYFSHDWFIYFLARSNRLNVFIDSDSYILYRIHDNNVHGQLNLNTYNSFKERLNLLKSGWYYHHIFNFIKLNNHNVEIDYIYRMYSKNVITRLVILIKYNFNLMRSKRKFIVFLITSLFIKSLKQIAD
jgi:rhamnosyltransferase